MNNSNHYELISRALYWLVENQHAQLCSRTQPAMSNGVSDANDVATIDVPAIHQGRLRPEMKNSFVLLPARRASSIPIPIETAR